jgi:hypothetical protein
LQPLQSCVRRVGLQGLRCRRRSPSFSTFDTITTMPLVDIADELYALSADEFTKARDAAAKNAKDDPDLAKAIKSFKRPTASAWLVNQLARQRGDRLSELLDLGDQLRAAQDALSGDDLRRLNRERHQLVHAVADEARELGAKVTDQVAREVEATLDAALADPEAGEAIRTGRLVRALSSAGFESVDLTDAVAVPDARPAPRTKAKTKSAAAPKKIAKQQPAQDKAKARRELTKARADADRLAKEVAAQDERLDAARERVDAARAEIERLEDALRDARTERAAAEKEIEKAQRERNATAREHRAAQQRLEKLS